MRKLDNAREAKDRAKGKKINDNSFDLLTPVSSACTLSRIELTGSVVKNPISVYQSN
jgi:hypothetical protein